MALDPTGPTANNWQAWLTAADATLKELMEYANSRRVFGLQGKPGPDDLLYQTLSNKELQQRNRGMALKRLALAKQQAATVQTGGTRLDTYE